MTEQPRRTEADAYGRQLELAAQRQAWQERRRQQREQEARQQKQAALQSYLSQRAQRWQETTGSAPSFEETRAWTTEYMNRREQEHQAERAERLARAEENYDF